MGAGRTISKLPGGHFVFTALHTSGPDVYIFGVGDYRNSDVFLSKTASRQGPVRSILPALKTGNRSGAVRNPARHRWYRTTRSTVRHGRTTPPRSERCR